MTVTGFIYGHRVYYDGDYWRYCDDNSLSNKDTTRVCSKCELNPVDYQGHDPCLANLPGVKNACCGHGIDEGYIQFEDGRIIRGFFEIWK